MNHVICLRQFAEVVPRRTHSNLICESRPRRSTPLATDGRPSDLIRRATGAADILVDPKARHVRVELSGHSTVSRARGQTEPEEILRLSTSRRRVSWKRVAQPGGRRGGTPPERGRTPALRPHHPGLHRRSPRSTRIGRALSTASNPATTAAPPEPRQEPIAVGNRHLRSFPFQRSLNPRLHDRPWERPPGPGPSVELGITVRDDRPARSPCRLSMPAQHYNCRLASGGDTAWIFPRQPDSTTFGLTSNGW